MENLISKKEFYDYTKTQEILKSSCYFKDNSGNLKLPLLLQEIFSKSESYENALGALGACIWYLKNSELDVQVLSMAQFEIYVPLDSQNLSQNKEMIIDSVSIENLKLLGGSGTLQKTLDYCQTAFGKRCIA